MKKLNNVTKIATIIVVLLGFNYTDAHTVKTSQSINLNIETNQLQAVFDSYFGVKNALVKSDGNATAANAKTLVEAIKAVKMENLTTEEHTVWMKIVKDTQEDAEHIAGTTDIAHQRERFISLSTNMYELMKVTTTDSPTYYQRCPMANKGKGANWLSKESAIKNPYYGSQMLGCGKTLETIK